MLIKQLSRAFAIRWVREYYLPTRCFAFPWLGLLYYARFGLSLAFWYGLHLCVCYVLFMCHHTLPPGDTPDCPRFTLNCGLCVVCDRLTIWVVTGMLASFLLLPLPLPLPLPFFDEPNAPAPAPAPAPEDLLVPFAGEANLSINEITSPPPAPSPLAIRLSSRCFSAVTLLCLPSDLTADGDW